MITEYKVKLLRLVITLLITEINKLINLMLRKFRRITKMDHVPLLRKMNASTQDSVSGVGGLRIGVMTLRVAGQG